MTSAIEHENILRKEIIAKYPSLDPAWAVNRCMDKYEAWRRQRFEASVPILSAVAEQVIEEIKREQ